MSLNDNVMVVAGRAKFLKEMKKRKMLKQKEMNERKIERECKKKEERQQKIYEELKAALLEYIQNDKLLELISIEENYMLIAKKVATSVNILKNVSDESYQPYKNTVERELCILSMIDYGRKTTRSALYDSLVSSIGCNCYRIAHIS